MEITHRVSFNKFSNVEKDLAQLGIKFQKNELPGENYTLNFDIKESDPNWHNVQTLVKEREFGGSIPSTNYSDEEILSSEFCIAIPNYETEYPFPEDSWISEKTRFYENFCDKCGKYSKQLHAYCINNEPKLKDNAFMTLVWGNLNIFVANKVKSILSSINEFNTVPVYLRDTSEVSKTISQLEIKHFTNLGIIPNLDVKFYECPLCHTLKYNYPKRGSLMYKKNKIKNVDFQYTAEWFGDGRMAYHLPIFSQKVVSIIIEKKLKGLQYKPVLLEEELQ